MHVCTLTYVLYTCTEYYAVPTSFSSLPASTFLLGSFPTFSADARFANIYKGYLLPPHQAEGGS